jgi:hypothetical protein
MRPSRKTMAYAVAWIVAVIVVVGLATALAHRATGHAVPVSGGPWSVGASVPAAPGPVSVPAGPPRYYADTENYGYVVVRATATGTKTAQLAGSGGVSVIAAAADNTTFYFGEDGKSVDTISSFRITPSGAITGVAPVRGGTLTEGGVIQSMAVSPDGTQLAVGMFFDPSPGGGGGPTADIIVVNLNSGVQTVWQGIGKAGWTVSIPSVSWTNGGRSIVYLAQWCKPGLEGTDTCVGGPHTGQFAEVWALNPDSGGGSLAADGRMLLAQASRYPVIAQALVSPDGTAIIAMVLSGPGQESGQELTIERISVATGKPLAVLLHGVAGEAADSSLTADGSGQYLLLADGFGPHHGWIHGGRLHLLPPTNGDGEPMAW